MNRSDRSLFPTVFLLVPLAVGAAIAGCSRQQSALVFEAEAHAILASDETSPVRAPQIAVSPAGKLSLLAVYGNGSSQRLGFAMSHDGGDHFMPLKPVSEDAGISAHGENNPQMSVSGRSIYALWEQSLGDGTREIVVARSSNEGASFEKPVRVNDNKTSSFHGFASIASDAKGNVYVAWLDGRGAAENPGTFDVYFARSSDRGASFGPNIRVAQSGCPCCRPAVAVGPDGAIFVAWRKVFPASVRDIVVSISSDGGQTFSSGVRVAEDKWQIAGCPESGAAIAATDDGLFVAWMTGGDDSRARLEVARSTDAGAHFHAPQSASREIRDPNHPSFANAGNGRLLLLFQGRPPSGDGKPWHVTCAFVLEIAKKSLGAPQVLAAGAKSAAYPVAAVSPTGEVFAAWTAIGDPTSSVMLLRGAPR